MGMDTGKIASLRKIKPSSYILILQNAPKYILGRLHVRELEDNIGV